MSRSEIFCFIVFVSIICVIWETSVSEAEHISTPSSAQRENFTDPITGMEFVFVPSGCFQMGNNRGNADEKPVHEVCVDDFYIGKYEVTQDEYSKVMESNPSSFKNGDGYPVEMVSWHDAKDFATELSSRSGRSYQLPTEAEWEYAARSGGKNEKYAGGDSVDAIAWYRDNSNGKTHPVGTKQANGLGIYDMSGNVWEWCQDWYGENYYTNSPKNNPEGPDSGIGRVVRGGGWHNTVSPVRTTERSKVNPSNPLVDDRSFRSVLGLRLVLLPQVSRQSSYRPKSSSATG